MSCVLKVYIRIPLVCIMYIRISYIYERLMYRKTKMIINDDDYDSFFFCCKNKIAFSNTKKYASIAAKTIWYDV